MDGCQECLRESRGDKVMIHDSAPVLQAPGMYSFFQACRFGAWQAYGLWYVQVRSIFFGVSVVFAYMSTRYALGGVAGLLVRVPCLFEVRPWHRQHSQCLALRPAPPDWASTSQSLRLGVRPVLPGPLLRRRGLSSLGGLLRRAARARLRSSGLSVGSFFAVIALFTQCLAFPDLRGFLERRSLRTNLPR